MLALVCLALVWAPLTAATATWDGGGGDGAWTNPLNWSADVQPGAADDVILTGPGPISITSAVTVRDLTVSADFSGTLMAGATVSVTRSCQLLGGTWLAGTQILSVGGDLIIADRSGAFLSGTGTVLLAGTGQLSNPHPDNAFHRLITAPAGHTTRVMSSLTITRLLTIGAGLCDIRQNAAARQIHLRGSGTVLERQGSGSLQGWWPNGCELWFESDGSAPMELPGMDYGQCAVRMLALGGASATFNQMGPMTNVHYVTTATESIYQRVTWNTNNHPVNVTVFLATGYQGSGGGTTWNAGSSVVNTGANFCWFTSSSDVINLGSSQLAAASIAAWSVSSQINPGTSTVTLTGGSIGVPWITRHLPFWNLTLAGSATTSVTPYGDLQVGKDLTIAGGTLASAARAVTVQGSLTVGDAGRLAVTTGTVSVGANLTLPDVAGAFAAGTGSVVLTGTGTLSAPGQAFHDLTTAPSGRSTRPLSDLLITHRLTVGGLLDLRQNAAVRQVHLRGSGQMLVVQPGGSIQGWFPNGGELCFEATGAAPMDLPGLDYGQCGIRLRTQGAVIGTFNQSGAIRNAHFLTTSADHVGGRTVWNTNGHDVALTVYLLTGTDGSMGGTTWNAGTSRIEAGSNFCWFTHASDVINLQDCRLSAGGFATWVPQVQVDPGTSTVAVRGGVGVPWWPHLHRLANLQLTGSGPGYLHGPVQCSGDVAIGSGGLQAGGELILDGAAPSTLDVAGPGVLAALRIAKPAGLQVSSALALQSLVVDPGSTVQWAAGRTVTTQALQLLGTAEQPIALASTQSGSPWLLNAAAPSPTAWVRVSDSDARAGTTIDATDHGVDLGSNQNWRFTIQHVAQPTISLASGTYQAAQNVTLSCATPSVVFRFSLDGSDPALSPLTTTESVLVSASATLRVVAERSGWQTSPEASATYVLQVQPVTASLPAGSHVGPQAVTLGCPTPGTTIVYTLDGTDPASSSTVAIATGPVQLPGSCTLRAIATLAGWSASAQFQAAYALQVAMPTITPAGGAVAAGTSVVISADAGILRYTTDGSDPAASASSQEAASPVSLPITAAMTVRAIGRTAGWTDSAEVSAAFSIQGGGGGDPEPPTAEVALAVVPADLTGQKFWNGLQLTNLPTVRFTVQATRVTSGWSVARLGVDSQGGSWSGASPVAADLPEGQQTVVAWAEVSKDGLTHRIVGQSLDLLVDRSEPVITLLEPGHTDGTKTLDAGLLSAGGRPLLLNRAADASALREIAGWRSWSVDGLDIPVLVEDVSGVNPDTAPTASIGSSALTVQLATPSTGGRDILHLTRFDAVPDAVTVDPATLVLLAGAGMQLLEVAVVDRCGNAATATMCSVWKKTTAGGAAFGYVPHQVGGFPASIGILDAQRHSSLAPVALLATPSDIVAVDQYAVAVNGVVTSLGSAMRLTQGADWAGLPGQGPALWQLRPVAADSLGNMRSAVVIRDATGNTLGTPSTPFPIITAWRPTRATAPEASTTLLQTEVELQTDRIEMRTLWSGWQLQGQWTGWLSRDTYLGYGWPTGIWVNYPVLTYSLAHVGRVGSTRSTQAPIPWEIEQPTEGAKLMVEMEGAASTLLTKVVTGVPESVHYGTITATHPGITGDGITYEGKLPIRIQDGPSNAVVEVVTAKPAPFTRDEARFVGIGPWDTHVYAQVQHERRVLDLQSGMLAWNTILDRPTQGPLVAAVPPSWSTAPMIVRYAPLADAGQVVVADANLPPITVSADAGGHLEIPMDRSLPGGFARVQRRKTAADGAQSWQHLGFRGMDLVKILGDVLATGQQTLRLEGGFQSQLSAKLPALSPMGNIRIIASTRRSWSEARLAGLAPRSAGNLDVIGTWLDAIASDAQVDMSGADAVAAGAASRQLATSLLMRQRELQSGMNAATRGVSASTLQAQYQAQTVAIANDTIRELWNQALPPDAVAQWLAVLSSAEMAAEAALAAATLAAVDQPATAAYALAARQAFQQRLDAARTWIATQRMMIAGWDSYRDAVRRGVEAYRQRLAPHEQFLDGMVSAYNSYFSSILVEPPASGWASGPMYVSTDYPGFDLEGWNQAQAAIQAIKAEEMFTAYNVASAQCENRIFHENLEHAAAAIAGAFADRTGSAGDVLAPRLFVVGQPAPEDIDPAVAIRQRYGVSMLIGDEAAGLYDVDVNIGAVHAYPDELSQQYAGANGSHRMKEALRIVNMEWVRPADSTAAAEQIPTSVLHASAPTPQVTVEGTPSVEIYEEQARLSFTGTITDPIVDQEPGAGNGPLATMTLLVDGQSAGTASVSVSNGTTGLWKPNAKTGRYTASATLPMTEGVHIVTARTQANGAGVVGEARVAVELHQVVVPGMGGVPAAGGGGSSGTSFVQVIVNLEQIDADHLRMWFGAVEPPADALALSRVSGSTDRFRVQIATTTIEAQIAMPAANLTAVGTANLTLRYILQGGATTTVLTALTETTASSERYQGISVIPGTTTGDQGGGGGGGAAPQPVKTWVGRVVSAAGTNSGAWVPLAVRFKGIDDSAATLSIQGTEYQIIEQDGWKYAANGDKPAIFGAIAGSNGASSVRLPASGGASSVTVTAGEELKAKVRAWSQDGPEAAVARQGLEEIDVGNAGSPQLVNYAHVGVVGSAIALDHSGTQVNLATGIATVKGKVLDPLDAVTGRSDVLVVVNGIPAEVEAASATPASDLTSARPRSFTVEVPLTKNLVLVQATAMNALGAVTSDIMAIEAGQAGSENPGSPRWSRAVRYNFGPDFRNTALGSSDWKVFIAAGSGENPTRRRVEVNSVGRVAVTEAVIVSRIGEYPDNEALSAAEQGEDGQLLRVANLNEDIWVIVEAPEDDRAAWHPDPRVWETTDAGWRRRIQQAGAEIDQDAVAGGLLVDRDAPGDVTIPLRTRNLRGGPLPMLVEQVGAGKAMSQDGPAMTAPSADSRRPGASPKTAVDASATMPLALGANRAIVFPMDADGMPGPSLEVGVFAADQDFPYTPGNAVNWAAGAQPGQDREFGRVVLPPREALVPRGHVFLIELVPGIEIGNQNLTRFLRRNHLEIVGSTRWEGDQIDPGIHVTLWVRVGGDRGFAEADWGQQRGVLIRDVGGSMNERQLMTDAATAMWAHMQNRPVRPGRDWWNERQIRASALNRELVAAQTATVTTAIVEPGGTRQFDVLDLRYSDAGMESIYNGNITALPNTRRPFSDALGILNDQASRNGSGVVRRYSYTAFDRTARRNSPNPTGDQLVDQAPRVFFNQGQVDHAAFVDSLRQADGLVIVIHGFNVGQGRDGDETGVVHSDLAEDDDPYQLLASYWPVMETTLRSGSISGSPVITPATRVLHVWWSGTFSGVLVSGSSFNIDMATAHITGRDKLGVFLRDLSFEVGDIRATPLPITVMAESLGNRVAVSAASLLSETPVIAARFGANGVTPLRYVMVHPALRQIDLTPEFEGDAVEGQSQRDNQRPHLYPESPLLSELNVLRSESADEARSLAVFSSFDKAGLAFLSGQRDDPSTPETDDSLPTPMLGRVGPNAPIPGRSAYHPAQGRANIRGHHVLGDVESTDFWHVDLFGWTLPNVPYRSRNIFTRNISSTGSESATGGGAWLFLSKVTETPSWHQIRIRPQAYVSAWALPRQLMQQGSVPRAP